VAVVDHLSPNRGGRRLGATPDLIVLHYTAMASAQAALDWLCDPVSQVSAHYLICQHGRTYRLVPEDQRAWHAGAGAWGACRDVNSRSIGIELANDGFSPFAAAQIDALERLLGQIMVRWPIPPERVIGHSDMAPTRKCDPGRRFDWRRLTLAGLSVWPEVPRDQPGDDQPGDEAGFGRLAAAFGYDPAHDPATLLDAFRQRFRPWATGPLDPCDMALMADLAHRFPVDQTALSA
jgi:N-acetylmuramoyl-L-alanine amidase